METFRACADPEDDIFLERAYAAKADYLATGNLRHFPDSWKNTRIVSPRWLLDRLEAEKPKGTSSPER